MKSPRTEVRCCCSPQKLRGWIEGHIPHAQRGQVIEFNLGNDRIVPGDVAFLEDYMNRDTIQMRLEYFRDGVQEPYLCFKAEGLDPKELNKIPAFIPAQ